MLVVGDPGTKKKGPDGIFAGQDLFHGCGDRI
jgi:hypothetical protein